MSLYDDLVISLFSDWILFFFFQAEDGIRDGHVTGVQTCALPILVRENIVRHVEMGADHMRAAHEGTDEIGLAVTATTFSIVAVFVPVGFMPGIAGQFFKPFA